MELKQLQGLIKCTIIDLRDDEEMAKAKLRLTSTHNDNNRLAYLQGRIEAYEAVLELLGRVEEGWLNNAKRF